jgi:hypothetical protein
MCHLNMNVMCVCLCVCGVCVCVCVSVFSPQSLKASAYDIDIIPCRKKIVKTLPMVKNGMQNRDQNLKSMMKQEKNILTKVLDL